VSVPLVPCLLDGVKFMLPGDVPRMEGTEAYRARAPRGPSLRSLVKLPRQSDAIEELGRRFRAPPCRPSIRMGHDRQRQRRICHRPSVTAPGSLWKIVDGNGPVKLTPL
jgi:hypothetical protein